MIIPLSCTARSLAAEGGVLLSADERPATVDRRLATLGLRSGPEARRAYREVLLSAPGLSGLVGAVAISEEATRQTTAGGTPFPELLTGAGLPWGVRADRALARLACCPGETVTEGLDGLRRRLAAARARGARFARWKAVFAVGDRWPSPAALSANGHALARFSACAQDEGLVPVLSAKVLRGGAHSLEGASEATAAVLRAVVAELTTQDVDLAAVVLAPTMILAGTAAPPAEIPDAALATGRCLLETVPGQVAGLVLSAGSQGPWDAAAQLNALNAGASLPWPVALSTGSALQEAVLEAWAGQPGRVAAVQEALAHRLSCHHAAAQGRWRPEMEAA